jgi:hypothetical protein
MYSLKKSCEYILLSTFKQEMVFLVIFRTKNVGNRQFLRRFRALRVAWKAYLTSLTPLTTTVLEPPLRSLALSK